jgi:hypothetical protein
MVEYIVFAVGAAVAVAALIAWVYMRLGARTSRGGRRW